MSTSHEEKPYQLWLGMILHLLVAMGLVALQQWMAASGEEGPWKIYLDMILIGMLALLGLVAITAAMIPWLLQVYVRIQLWWYTRKYSGSACCGVT